MIVQFDTISRPFNNLRSSTVDTSFLATIERFFGRKRLTEVVREAIDKRNETKKPGNRKLLNEAIDDLGRNLKKKGKPLSSKKGRDTARPLTTFLIENASNQQAATQALLRIWLDQVSPKRIASIDEAVAAVGLLVTIDRPEAFSGAEWSKEAWTCFRDALNIDGTRFDAEFAAVLRTGLVPPGSYVEITPPVAERVQQLTKPSVSNSLALASPLREPSEDIPNYFVRTARVGAGGAGVSDGAEPRLQPVESQQRPNAVCPPLSSMHLEQASTASPSAPPSDCGFGQFIRDCMNRLRAESAGESWWPDEPALTDYLRTFEADVVALREASVDRYARSMELRKAFEDLKSGCARALELLDESWLLEAELATAGDGDVARINLDLKELRTEILAYESTRTALFSSKHRDFEEQVANVRKQAETIGHLIARLRPHLRVVARRDGSTPAAEAQRSTEPDGARSSEDEECASAAIVALASEPESEFNGSVIQVPERIPSPIDNPAASAIDLESSESVAEADFAISGTSPKDLEPPFRPEACSVKAPAPTADATNAVRQFLPGPIETGPEAEMPRPLPPSPSSNNTSSGSTTSPVGSCGSEIVSSGETGGVDLPDATFVDEDLLSSLISKDQIEVAYWLLESQAAQAPLRLTTLRILLGTELLKNESDLVAAELERELQQFTRSALDLNRNEKLLVCATACRLVFLHPSVVQQQMFEMPSGLPITASFFHLLEKFANSHRSLTPYDLEQTHEYVKLRTLEEEKTGRLAVWWKENGSEQLGDFSCTKVWLKISVSAVQSCVDAALRRQFRPEQFNREPWTLSGPQQIRAYCRRIGSEATSDHGYALIDRTLNDAKTLIRECTAASERLGEADRKLGHNGRGLLALRTEAESTLGPMRAEWDAFLQNASGLSRAAMLCLISALEGIAEHFLRLESARTTAAHDPVITRVPSIKESLDNALLLFPDLPRNTDDEPDLRRLPALLHQKPVENRQGSAICREWIRLAAFDSARDLALLLADQKLIDQFQADIADALLVARSTLIRRKQELSDMLELRFLDGCISETERAELDSILSNVPPAEVAQFPPQHRRLDEVQESINSLDARTRAGFSETWVRLRPDLDRVDATAEERAEYCRLVEMNLERGNFRAVDELFAFLGTAADEGGPLDPVLLPAVRPEDHLDIFLQNFASLSELATAAPSAIAAKIGESGRPLLERWMSLYRLGTDHLDKLTGPVSELLTSVGFIHSKDQPPTARPERVGGTMVRLRVPMSINHRDARPFWQFGSRSKTTNVLLVWPSQSSLFSTEKMVREILDNKLVGGGPGLLVLYFGRLALEKRRLRTDAQSDDIEFPVAVLDDVLLLHLAGLVGSRASALLRCSLPFATANPYIDSGQVLQEMFFGRTGHAASLQRYPGGQSIIYGGRQLGKSALLDQVEREFNNPIAGTTAIVKDIKANFDADGGSDPNDLWQLLLGEFRDRKLVPSTAVSKIDTIQRYLTEAVSPTTGRSVLVMFDEADRFLIADQKNGFRVVSGLRDLVRSTEGRLRFVFAGLSTVARFQGTPNNPLVQFGEPLCVGPLPPTDARNIVIEPLRACGLRFERDEDALLIFASTGYHTKLLQYFCKRLVRRMHEKQFRSSPPYFIRRSDIEAITQAREFGEQLRKIFDLTVRVDIENRYRAVVLSMAYDAMDPRKTGPRSYSAQDVADSVSNWCKNAFPKETGASDDLQCLLTEMCGMGLLIRDRASKYRLRSPNLARLLGDRNTIETQLLELENAPIRLQADSESGRGQLEDGSYSCFTYVQERGIRQTASGIVLVTGSSAHGLSRIRESLRRAGPNLDAACEIIPPDEAHSPSKLRDWLNQKILPVALKSGALTCVCYLPANDARVPQFVEQGSEFCKKQAEKRQVRIVFVLPPKSLLDWLRLPKDGRDRLEGAVGFVAGMRRWNSAGIRQRLLDSEISSGEPEIAEIRSVTGGWHVLVEEVFGRLATNRDIAKVLRDVVSQWEQGSLRKELRLASAMGDLGEEISFIQTNVAPPDVHGVTAEVVECLRRLDCLTEDASGVLRIEPRLAEALRRP
jgi:hypothetical protein